MAVVDLKRLMFKQRGITPIPVLAVVILFANPTPPSLIIGSALVILGEIIRLWAVSYAGGATRTRRVGAHKLFTNGPFARTRNPIYIGNLLVYFGVAWAANILQPWFALAVMLLFGIQYYLIILLEEEKLRELFGAEYEHYSESVPRLIPRISSYSSKSGPEPSLGKALRSEVSTLLAIFATSLFIAGRSINIW